MACMAFFCSDCNTSDAKIKLDSALEDVYEVALITQIDYLHGQLIAILLGFSEVD